MKQLLDEGGKKKKNSEKAGLKLNIQSTKITESHKVASVLWQIEWENMERVTDFVFLDSKITGDDDYSHKIKRCLLLGRKAMRNLGSLREALLFKQRSSWAIFLPVVLYGCESWAAKKTEHWRSDSFKSWCWRRFLRFSWSARRSNQSILNEIIPEYSLEGLILKLMLQYFGHLMGGVDSLEKILMLGKIEGSGRRGQ